MADEEDPFADLLGPYGLQQPEVKEEVQVMRPSPVGKEKDTEPASSEAPDRPNNEAKEAGFVEPRSMPANMFVLPKEETKEFVKDAVEATVEKAVQASVGKLVSSMREVLRVVVQRMESLEAKVGSLHSTVSKLDVESTQTNLHARFTSIDEGLRDIGRSVQAMRDRSELLDTQKELARLQIESEAQKKKEPGISDTGRTEAPASNASETATQPSAPPPTHQQTHVTSVAAPPAPSTQVAAPQQPVVHPPPAPGPPPAPQPPPQPAAPPPAPPPPPATPAPSPYPQHEHSAASVPQHPHAQASQTYAPPSSAPPPPAHYSSAPAVPQQAQQQQGQSTYPGPPPPAHYPELARQVAPTSAAQYPTFAPPPPPPSSNFGGYPQQPPPPVERGSRYLEESSRFSSSSGPANLAAQRPPPPPNQQGAPREGMSTMSTQQIVSDLCSMGFERGRVERVLGSVIQQGKGVDLNSVVDILMNSTQ